MKRKQKEGGAVAVKTQLRSGESHPFATLQGFTPLGSGEERMYRQLRQAIPVLDAAIGKLVRLSGGFSVRCAAPGAQKRLATFLKTMPAGYGPVGIDSFLSGYVDSLLTYGRAVGEMVVSGGKLRAICWGDVTALEIQEGENPLDMVIWGADDRGRMMPLPYQNLLLFKSWPVCFDFM